MLNIDIDRIKEFIKHIFGLSLRQRIKRYKQYMEIDSTAILLPNINIEFRMERKACSIKIDENSMLGCNFIFESDQGYIKVGKRTFINAGTNLISRERIEIGNDVTIGWGCYLYDHNSHSIDYKERMEDIKQQREDYMCGRNFTSSKNWTVVASAPIKVCDKAWIGFNSIILKGVTIGEGAVVAAGSVVTRDVEPWTVVGGNPARFIKNIER